MDSENIGEVNQTTDNLDEELLHDIKEIKKITSEANQKYSEHIQVLEGFIEKNAENEEQKIVFQTLKGIMTDLRTVNINAASSTIMSLITAKAIIDMEGTNQDKDSVVKAIKQMQDDLDNIKKTQ